MLNKKKISQKIYKDSFDNEEKNLKKVFSHQKEILKKASQIDISKLGKFYNQIKLTLEMLRDYKNRNYVKIPWRTIGLLSAVLIYFLNPFDILPDFLPVFGLTDDAIALASVFRSFQDDLLKYCRWKNYNTELYF